MEFVSYAILSSGAVFYVFSFINLKKIRFDSYECGFTDGFHEAIRELNKGIRYCQDRDAYEINPADIPSLQFKKPNKDGSWTSGKM